MTKGELQDKLAGLPDDAEVKVAVSDQGEDQRGDVASLRFQRSQSLIREWFALDFICEAD